MQLQLLSLFRGWIHHTLRSALEDMSRIKTRVKRVRCVDLNSEGGTQAQDHGSTYVMALKRKAEWLGFQYLNSLVGVQFI